MKNLTITAKEWFDKTNGNSYFSARIESDGELIAILPFQYGYGNHYIDMAGEWLANNNYMYLPRHANGSRKQLWDHCRSNGIHLETFKQEKCLKRELDKEAYSVNSLNLAV